MDLNNQQLAACAAPAPGGAAKRIAFISAHASPLARPGSIDCDGQRVYVACLARELAASGHQVDIFTRRDCLAQQQVVRWRDNIRVVHVPAGPPRYVPREQMLPYMDSFARFVTRFARRQPAPYHIAHANLFLSGMAAHHLKQVLGIPFVITFHALDQVRRMAQGTAGAFPAVRLRIEASLMRNADRIIAASPHDQHNRERLYDAPPSRIAIVPRGFDPHELWPVPAGLARAQLGLPPHKFIVLQLGRIVPRKGVDTAIRSLALLRHHYGVDAELLVVGGDTGRPDAQEGPELARLRAAAAQLGVREHVRFTGHRPRADLRAYYSAADVFVSTPWYGSSGITPVEAMACARPVVGAEVGAIKSTVIDGATGFLVPPRDAPAVAERLAMLHGDPALARSLGDAGLRRAHQYYTWRSVAHEVTAIYAAILHEGGIRPRITALKSRSEACART